MDNIHCLNQVVRAIQEGCSSPLDMIDEVAFEYQRSSLLSKMEPGILKPITVNTADAALKSFLDQELVNRITNEYLSSASADMNAGFLHEVLYSMGQHIQRVLGKLNLDDVLQSAMFGPGVNIGCGGKTTSTYNKLVAKPTSTVELLPFSAAILATLPAWAAEHSPQVGPYALARGHSPIDCTYKSTTTQGDIKCVYTLNNFKRRLPKAILPFAGGKFFTVPKNDVTDRGCEKQPILNTFLQKGIGAVIRKRIKAVCGIDLRKQSNNRHAAREGSIHGRFATIDLANASNSICYWLVRQVLPADWFHLLDIARTHRVELPDGSIHELELFSAMGNGFTFELESLIFWAACKAACEIDGFKPECLLVYGDDIVVDTETVPSVVATLRILGFEINGTKSFWHGDFRESCGGDFFQGHNITPLKIKTLPSQAGEWCRLANLIRRTASNRGHGLYAHSAYKKAWEIAAAMAFSKNALCGPSQLDGCVHVSVDDEPFRHIRKRIKEGGYIFDAVEHRESSISHSTKGHVLTTAYSLSRMCEGDDVNRLLDEARKSAQKIRGGHNHLSAYALDKQRTDIQSAIGSGSRYDLRRTTKWRWVKTEVFAPLWEVPFL